MIPIGRAIDVYRDRGISGVLSGARDWAGYGLVKRLHGPKTGVEVVDEDWDNLIILDACRYDAFASVSRLPGTLEQRTSQASVTWSFLKQNFEGRQLYDTVYVAANAVVGENAGRLNVFKLVGLWTEIEQGDIVDPSTVVERTLDLHEQHPNKRLVAHFLQPHTPFVHRDGERLSPESPYRDYDAIRDGEVSQAAIRATYEENLTDVLDHVRELIDQLDGRTVVTADHGELLGEGVGPVTRIAHPRWSVRDRRNFDYGHYSHVRLPELTTVPWQVIEGDERREIVAAAAPAGVEMETESIDQQLEALGYK